MEEPIRAPQYGDTPRPLALSLPALVGLVLGALLLPLAIALWVGRPPGEESPDVLFVRDMMAHHEQAVEMALIMRDRATDETIRILANDIILTQQNQSGRMAGWLEIWGRPIASQDAPMGGRRDAMGMAPQGAVNSLQTLPVDEAETRFLQLMIPHHEGGVMMAKAALDAGVRPEVERLATSILNGQQQEVDQMRDMLSARGADIPPPLAAHDH
jgi:uncharacterized protein (DUF305 family)